MPDLHEGRFKIQPERFREKLVPTRRAAYKQREFDKEIEDRYKRHAQKGHHHHVYDVHKHLKRELFDVEDPMSDSDYDDLDEQTGKYHDSEPITHPAQHVKEKFSEG